MTHVHKSLLLLLPVVAACASPVAPDATGTWGGSGASVVLGADGGSFAYTCGWGTIDAGWTLGAGGAFAAVGEIHSGAGPIPVGGGTPHPTVYSGHVRGSRMSLTVTMTDSGTTLGPFDMVKGGPPAQEICD